MFKALHEESELVESYVYLKYNKSTLRENNISGDH